MRLVSYGPPRAERPGILVDDDVIVPLDRFLADFGLENGGMNAVIGLIPQLLDAFDGLCAKRADAFAAGPVRLGPPVPRPGQILAVGANYAAHVREAADVALPSAPILFAKAVSCLSGPSDDIVRPTETQMLDYEIELGVVIGRGGRRIGRESALQHVAGYVIANDVTARDVVRGDAHIDPMFLQILRGKGFDTFCPTGPWLVTTDEIGDPAGLRLQLWVNDEARQDGTTADMIFDVPAIIASASSCFTLRPGDVILTGSPPGVAASMKPPRFLTSGDVVRASIDGLGTMRTAVRDE